MSSVVSLHNARFVLLQKYDPSAPIDAGVRRSVMVVKRRLYGSGRLVAGIGERPVRE
jgi:hypothetical protein